MNNACIRIFHGVLKKRAYLSTNNNEHVLKQQDKFGNTLEIFQYIVKESHSTNDYLSPAQKERMYELKAA